MTAVAPEPFDVWFRRKLSERGWSQERAAREIGGSYAAVRKWVQGTKPSYDQLVQIVFAVREVPPELDPRRADYEQRLRRLRAELHLPQQQDRHRESTEGEAGDLDDESATGG